MTENGLRILLLWNKWESTSWEPLIYSIHSHIIPVNKYKKNANLFEVKSYNRGTKKKLEILFTWNKKNLETFGLYRSFARQKAPSLKRFHPASAPVGVVQVATAAVSSSSVVRWKGRGGEKATLAVPGHAFLYLPQDSNETDTRRHIARPSMWLWLTLGEVSVWCHKGLGCPPASYCSP